MSKNDIFSLFLICILGIFLSIILTITFTLSKKNDGIITENTKNEDVVIQKNADSKILAD